MTDAKRLNVADIDFDSIRTNLKDYMRSQDTLQDYDFEGSAISSIIDLLAYVTHYNAVNANIGLNETFLDSAQFRGSVVGHARQLGYTSRSATAPVAEINVTVNSAEEGEVVRIPRGHRFKTKIGNTSYSFLTTEEYTSTNGSFSNVSISQVEFKTAEYIFDTQSSERYVIPDANVDTSTLRVTVLDSRTSNTSNVYVPAKSLVGIGDDSRVYFLHENYDGLFELTFTDNSVGVPPQNGNIIVIEYGVTQIEAANGARVFSLVDPISGYSDVGITTVQSARGGAERESIDSIKRNAPITFASQNRAVTARDYEAIVRENFDNILSVRAWGGEDNDPPVYGKAFVSIQPRDTDVLSTTEKSEIVNDILIPKSSIAVIPEIVDPELIYLSLDVEFNYDPSRTRLSETQIKNKVIDAIRNYGNQNLNRFNSAFRYSQLLNAIDESDDSVLNSFANVFVQKRFTPSLVRSQEYTLDFVNTLYDPNQTANVKSVINETSRFAINGIENCILADFADPNNQQIRVIHAVKASGENAIVKRRVGYIQGSKIILDDFTPSSFFGLSLQIDVVIRDRKDVIADKNNILTLETNGRTFSVTPKADTTS
jgi:hypothetical protein